MATRPADISPTEQRFAVGFARMLTMRDVDARSGPARQVLTTARALARDLGGDDLPIAQRILIQRSAMLATLCTHTEAALLLGQDASLADYIAMSNTLRRLLVTLGIKRVPKDITPDPLDYARERDE